MRRILGVVLISAAVIIVLWLRGLVPISGDFMRAWFEPWKTIYSPNGVPVIPHKAVGDDVFRQIYPFKVFSADLLRRGSLPLWDPYNGAGQPLFASPLHGLVNPLNAAFFLWSPERAWTVLYVGQFTVLAVTTVVYVTSLGLTSFAAGISVIILLLSGYVVANSVFATYMYGYAGLPLLLWSVDRLVQRKRGGLVLPFAVAWTVLTGFPQLSVYIFLIAAAYAALRISENGYPLRTSLWVKITGLAVLGLGLSAVQIWPTAELYMQAAISAGSSAFIFRNFLLPAQHFVSVMIPNFFGNPSTYNFWGPAEYTESVSAVGITAVYLALLAVPGTKNTSRRTVIFFVGVIVSSILLSLRWAGTEALYRLPVPVWSTGAPSRIMGMATFAFAVLAGFGCDKLLQGKAVKQSVWKLVTVTMVLIATLLLLLIFIWKRVPCNHPVITACFAVALRNSLLESAAFGIFALTVVIRMKGYLSRRIAASVIFAVLLVSGLYNLYKFVPFTKETNIMPAEPVLSELARLSPGRVGYLGNAVIPTDFATAYRFFDTNYYNPLYIRRYGELVSYVNSGDREKDVKRSDVIVVSDATVSAALASRRDRFWDMTGTRALVTKLKDHLMPGNTTVWADTNWRIAERPTALPRAYVVGNVRVEPDADKELAAIFDRSTDLRTTAFVEENIPAVTNSATGSADITSYEANRVVIRTSSSGPAFLVMSDTFYPGWVSTVDGKDTRVYRTNYAFRGIEVPEGTHTVSFVYDPISFRAGAAISILSVVLWGVVVIRRRKFD